MDHNRLDVSAKELVLDDPAAWADRFGIGPPGPVSVIDSEIATLTAFADKVLKVGAPAPYLLNLEPHSYHDKDLARGWNQDHDRPVFERLLAIVQPDFHRTTWNAFRRFAMDGLPAVQVAAELGVTENAVLQAKSRILKRLRAERGTS